MLSGHMFTQLTLPCGINLGELRSQKRKEWLLQNHKNVRAKQSNYRKTHIAHFIFLIIIIHVHCRQLGMYRESKVQELKLPAQKQAYQKGGQIGVKQAPPPVSGKIYQERHT